MLLFLFLLLHPYHVSVTEVRFDEEVQSVQITERIFIDDLEEALRKANNDEKFVLMDDSLISHQYLKTYFEQNFVTAVNGKTISYDYLGAEVEDDVIWCYIEITGVESLQSIKLTNSIMTEVFDDQKNLVHFKIGGEKKSFILSNKEIVAEYQK
ncbi:MAG: hypothetical protein CMB80_07320 [Flammeovirgaceae bacterium]|nr:hypothetical protein [Flammeovirgaceae bacterium]|tara:strand:- start:9652 stop:10113 length:462 start_codon:yes stop_codon:yes gene_type:complete